MKKNLLLLTGVIISLLISYGCEKEHIIPIKTATSGQPITGTISFSKDIVPIFNSKCTACHGNNGQVPNLATKAYDNLKTRYYINTAEPAKNKIYIKLNLSSSTHASKSSAEDQAKILFWIEKGAENN